MAKKQKPRISVHHLESEILNKLSVLVTTAFGLVAALAWNAVIQNWFERQPYLKIGGPLVYAILVTIIAVILTVWIGHLTEKTRERIKP